MLVSFSVSNFRSFGEEQTLNMIASNKLTEHPNHLHPIDKTGKSILRAAVIYGANAAGKSNLVKAMSFAQNLIGGDERRLRVNDAFRFRSDLMTSPMSFEFRFLIQDRVFIYGFDVSGRGIKSEWLSVLEGSDEVLVFERMEDGSATLGEVLNETFPDDESIAQTLKLLAQLKLTRHQLLLNRVSTLPEETQGATLKSVTKWLTQDLIILNPDYRATDILDRLSDDDYLRKLAEAFLEKVGTGISGLDLVEEELPLEDLPGSNLKRYFPGRFRSDGLDDIRPKPDDPTRAIARRLLAKHPVGTISTLLPFSEESDGTKQLLHLMPLLAAGNLSTKVFVIDELDRSLHPLICWEFIRLFSETATGARKQLIVTTHEAHLLNQELLRRDEYWFVEKGPDQQSRLVPLSEYKIRNDLQIEKSYLQGRFGAIPVIGSMAEIENLLDDGKKGM